MTDRKKYKKPVAMNLSGLSAIGYGTRGLCIDGSAPSNPSETCYGGSSPAGDPSSCSPNGISPETGSCQFGDSAQNICSNGSIF